MNQSPNIPVNNEQFMILLATELAKVRNGCPDGFTGCCICESDYSIQWADVAITTLYKHKIVSKRTKDNVFSKLYDGHRG